MSRFKVGLSNLDREYNGLFPEGHISAIDSSFKSDSDKFVYHIMNNNRDKTIIYISLQKSKDMVKSIFTSSEIITNSDSVRIVDVTDTKNISEEVIKTLQKAPDNSLVVIDPILEIERNSDNYKNFMNDIYTIVNNQDLLLLLYNSDNSINESQLTYDFADSIINIEMDSTSRVEFDHFLTISKFRNRKEFEEKERLDILKDKVKIDTTRNVA